MVTLHSEKEGADVEVAAAEEVPEPWCVAITYVLG